VFFLRFGAARAAYGRVGVVGVVDVSVDLVNGADLVEPGFAVV
jgi:hypothetical protein